MSDDERLGREFELMMALRLLCKAIHRLDRLGARKQAEEIIAEAKAFGFDLVIMPDPTDERN